MSRAPKFVRATLFVGESMTALSRAAANLRVEGQLHQHPLYYRANQFWRQLEEFRNELDRAAKANAYDRQREAVDAEKPQ